MLILSTFVGLFKCGFLTMGARQILVNIFFIFCTGISMPVNAQLIVNPNVNNNQLMSALIAQGLTVSNVQLNCTQGAYGTFNGASSNLGIGNGILLTTGNVSLAVGPNNSANIGANNQIQFSDPQLTGLVSNANRDPCILEFDVIPNCDSLEIRYVFGSEEYMEFVNRSFNDAFGFFITGPNPSGPAYNNTNIAWIPGTTTPVSVQNVNLNTNSTWYFDNGNGQGNGTAPDGASVQYDGFTKVMTVKVRLQPCALYHFKIAIADAGDHVVDSGVFIDYLGCGNLLTVNPSSTNSTSCIACNGTASVSVSGGSSPYTYSWSNGSTASTATGLCPGTYTVTVRDHNVCSNVAVQTFTIGGGNNLSFSNTSQTDIACGTACSGVASVTVTGGTPAYTYQWLPSGGNTATANNLCAGTYTVTVTDSQGCTLKQSFSITQNTITATQGQTNQGCSPNCVGAASIIVTNGTWPYTYNWSNGNFGPGAFNLCAGVYSCTVSDAAGCSTIKTFTITNLPPIVYNTTQTNINCNSVCNGTARINVTGGTPSFSYSWYPGAQTSSSVTGLCAGYYSVHVTDGNGCSIDEYFYISNGNALYLNYSQTDASCNGACDGTATVTPQGGTPGYSYSWAPSGGTNSTATGLCQGTYSCTVRDAGGCEETQVFYIYQSSPANVYVSTTGAACNGTCDGTATANVYGGTSPYTYSWSSSAATTSSISGLCQGNYTLTVTDASGCTSQVVFSIAQAQPPYVYVSNTDAACNGTCNAVATANVFGGAAPYSYSWSSSATTPSISGLCQGSYTLTVTDSVGCSVDYAFTVNQAQPPSIYPTQTDVSCHGGCVGSATVAVYGGVAPYQYSWSPSGGTNANATGLCIGTYTSSITDSIGCRVDQLFTIVQAPTISITPYEQNPSCGGVCDGYISVFVQGGIPQYTYSWNNGSANSFISGVCAGVFSLTVTDEAGCTAVQTYTLTDPSPILVNISKLDISCNGLADGSATSNPTGGTGFYNYYWSNNQFTQSISPLTAGAYTVTVYDSNGCSKTDTVTIIDPPLLQAGGSSTPVSCIAATGTATGLAIGGTPAYTYNWGIGQTGVTITGLNAGIYSLTVTDSRGCTSTNSINVINSGGPRAYIVSFTNPLCNNGADGTATASAVGGLSPYTYSWNNAQTTATASGLSVGAYTVTVSDIFGCSSIDTVRLSQPPAFITNVNSTPASCGSNNGTATAAANGGTPGYFYFWNTASTNASISGLNAGVYTVTVSDANSCTSVLSTTVTNSNGPAIALATTSISCNGGNNGSIIANVGGGGPYTYNWSNAQTTSGISSLTTGLYSVTVTDAGGCSSVANTSVTEPAIISATLSVTDASCGLSNGNISTSIGGGVSPYNYSWSNAQTTSAVTGLTASVYSVTITDANTCTSIFTSTVNNTASIVVALNTASVSCNGGNDGNISTNINGGTAPYSYSWSTAQTTSGISSLTAGVYSVTITDAVGCSSASLTNITEPAVIGMTVNPISASCGQADGSATTLISGGVIPYTYSWSGGSTNTSATGLAANNYTLQITDLNGCTSIAAFVIANVNGPQATIASQQDVLCNAASTGSISINVVSGTQPYTYLWNNSQTTSAISSLTAGLYSVTVTDAGGCSSIVNASITEPTPLSATLTVTDASCGLSNGNISTSIGGGVSPYNYSWSNAQTTSAVTGLTASVYSVTITDANGCTSVYTATVNNTVGPVIAFNTNSVSCNGGNDGNISTNINGGTGPYSYSWSNTQTTSGISSLNAGTYSLTVTDAVGCSSTASTNITEPAVISITVNPVAASCGQADGSSTALINGGNAPYSYSWSSGSTNNSATGLAANNYSLQITDINGCTSTIAFAITNANGPLVNISSQQDVLCNATSTGSVSISVVNGTQPYTYLWNNNQTVSAISSLIASVYSVTVTDAGGCTNALNVNITEPAALIININSTDASCANNNGTAIANANGGTGNYNFMWSNALTSNSVSALSPGIYSLTVTDGNGCTAINTATIGVTGGLGLTPAMLPVSCNGDADGEAGVIVNTGTAPFTYVWNNASTTATISSLTAATYSVLVADASGCTATLSVNVTEPSAIVIVATTSVSICSGQNAQLSALANGGSGVLNYLWNPGAVNGSTLNVSPTSNTTFSLIVTDANGCTAESFSDVIVNELPQVNFTATDSLGCEPLCIVFNTSALNVSSLNWDFGDGSSSSQTSPSHCYTLPGQYGVSLSVTDNNGCSNSFTKNNYITVYTNPIAGFTTTPPITSILNPVVQLNDQSQGANSWAWNMGDELQGTSTQQNVTYIYSDTGSFEITLVVTSPEGCTDTAYETVIILPDYILYIPNSFTPNGDGINDLYFPKGMGILNTNYRFMIFDRWGEKIFESNDFTKGWDGNVNGNPAQIDVYVWKIEAHDVLNKPHFYTGHVSLVR